MGAGTKIQWAHYTFNPWRGCQKVSPGCANCYAERQSKRNPAVLGEWGPQGRRVIAAESYWRLPLKWNRDAEEAGERRRVFCASLADVFEDRPELREPRIRLWELIDQTPHLDWLLLTKRPKHLTNQWQSDNYEMLPWQRNPWTNVWLGVSVENQEAADRRISELFGVPAWKRFLSCEPLLGSIDVSPYLEFVTGVSGCLESARPVGWIIVGGESGPNARPCVIGHVREIVRQCRAAQVPCFVKQIGAKPTNREGEPHPITDPKGGDPNEWPADLRVREVPDNG